MLRESRGMHDRARTEAVDRLMSELEIFFFLALWLTISRIVGKVCIHQQRAASRGPPSRVRVVFCARMSRERNGPAMPGGPPKGGPRRLSPLIPHLLREAPVMTCVKCVCVRPGAPPTHAFSGLVGVCMAERALERNETRERNVLTDFSHQGCRGCRVNVHTKSAKCG